MSTHIDYYKNEVNHITKQAGRKTIGGVTTAIMRSLTGGGSAGVTVAVRRNMASGSTYVWGIVGILSSILLRFYLNIQDNLREKERLRDLFRKEVASLTGKDHIHVTTEDFLRVAATNPILQQAVDRSNHSLAFSNTVALLATLASFAAVFLLMPASIAAAGGIAATIFGISTATITFTATKKLLTAIGNKVLNIKNPTAISIIDKMEKTHILGNAISIDDTMAVYVISSPKLAQTIIDEFGKPYSKLSHIEKREAIAKTGLLQEIENITLAINEGRMNPRELAFYLCGQSSGVTPDPNIRDQLSSTLAGIKMKLSTQKQRAAQYFNSKIASNYISPHQHEVTRAAQNKNTHNNLPFVDKLHKSTARKHNSHSWQQYINQQASHSQSAQPLART